DIRTQRNVVAGLADGALHGRDASAEAQHHVVEILQQTQVEVVFLQPARVELDHETNLLPAAIFPSLDRTEVNQVRRVHADVGEQIVVLFQRDSLQARVEVRRELANAWLPNEPAHETLSRFG